MSYCLRSPFFSRCSQNLSCCLSQSRKNKRTTLHFVKKVIKWKLSQSPVLGRGVVRLFFGASCSLVQITSSARHRYTSSNCGPQMSTFISSYNRLLFSLEDNILPGSSPSLLPTNSINNIYVIVMRRGETQV